MPGIEKILTYIRKDSKRFSKYKRIYGKYSIGNFFGKWEYAQIKRKN